MFSTGITACDQLIGISLQGNIIPQIWYKVFVKKDLKYPKPHLLAINILADIVFWYRPREERDEITGAIIGYSKRFSGDLLQRSYEQLANMFGCSKGQATDAIVFLQKEMGVVERKFENRNINGVVCNNILYISLNVERLKELTYPHDFETPPEVSGNFGTGVAESPHSSPKIYGEGVAKFKGTNTEITTKNTTEITPSIHLAPTQEFSRSDGLSEDELRDIVEDDFFEEKAIPYVYKLDERKMKTAIKVLVELTHANFDSDLKKSVLDMFIDCLTEMVCADGIQTYKGASVSYAKVIDKINEIVKRANSLYEFAGETIDDYVSAAKEYEIKDKRKYMKSVIWNSLSTYKVKFDSFFARTYYGGQSAEN